MRTNREKQFPSNHLAKAGRVPVPPSLSRPPPAVWAKLTGAGLAGLGKGGMVAMTAGIGAAMAGAAAAVGLDMKSVTAAADFEQTKVALPPSSVMQ